MINNLIPIFSRIRKNIYLVLLIGILVFNFMNNAYFLSSKPLVEGKDSYAHLTAFINFSQILKHGSENIFYNENKSWLHNLFFFVVDYPPFFYISAFLVSLVLGKVFLNAALLTATVFLIILLGCIYRIGANIDRQTGFLAALLCSFYPIIFLLSRHFNLELALASLVSLSFWLMLKTMFFENLKYSVLLGIVLGVGMLTKQTFILYVIGPVCISFCSIFTQKDKAKTTKGLRNFFTCLIIALGISALFYGNKEIYANIFNRLQFSGAVENKRIFSMEHLLYYPKSFTCTLGYFFSFIFVLSLFFLRKIERVLRYLLLAWIIVPFVVLSFINLKYAEYTAAFLPACALISASGLRNIKNKKLFAMITVFICALGLYLNYDITYSGKNFYATYYKDKSYKNIFFKNFKSNSKNQVKNVNDLSISLGESDAKIGIFYDHAQLIFPAYFIRRIFSMPNTEAQIVDLLFRTTAFFKKLDEFETLIFISRDEREWVDENSFGTFLDDLDQRRFQQIEVINDRKDYVYTEANKIYISKFLVDKLINSRRQFQLEYKAKFMDYSIKNFEYVYFYRRKG